MNIKILTTCLILLVTACTDGNRKNVTSDLDITPESFSFEAVVDQNIGILVTSNPVTISGMDIPVPINIVNGEYSINQGPFTSEDGVISDGDLVIVRGTSSSSFSTSVDIILTVGGIRSIFSMTTQAPNVSVIFPITDFAIGTIFNSNAITLEGINDTTPITITGGEYSINQGEFTSEDGVVNDLDSVIVRATAPSSFSTSVNLVLTVGLESFTFSITTQTQDIIPDAFVFDPITDTGFGVVVSSNAITLAGTNEATTITITGGEYSIDGEAFTSAPSTITNGQSVVLQHTTSTANVTLTETMVSIGGVDAIFKSTTQPQPEQLVIVGSGTDLVLVWMELNGQLTERSRASLDSELVDYSDNHVIFSITKHPTMNMVFVTSMNECTAVPNSLTSGCAGNARIDRFRYDSNTITYDGLAFLAQTPLRMSTPSFDVDNSVLTMTVRNQGDSDVTISSLIVFTLSTGSEFSTTCNDADLTPGDSCAVTITAGPGVAATGEVIIVTSNDIEYYAEIMTNDDESEYFADGLNPSVTITELPICFSTVAANDGLFYYFPNQAGNCALTALAISSDGSRAYVTERSGDTIIVLSLDANGNMAYLSSDDVFIDYDGIAVNTDNSFVYSGSNSFSVNMDQLTEVNTNQFYGNATEFLTATNGANLVVTTEEHRYLSFYIPDTDPLLSSYVAEIDTETSPLQLVAYIDFGSGDANFQAHSADLSTFAIVGISQISTATFDGETLNHTDIMQIQTDFTECLGCDFDITTSSVAMTTDGAFAISGLFVDAYDQQTINTAPFLGAVTSYSIEPITAELTEVDMLQFDGTTRTLLLVDTP